MKKTVNDMEETQITYKIKKMRVGEHVNSASTKYYPVFSENDEELYCVSADRKDLRVNIKYVLRGKFITVIANHINSKED